MELAGNSEPALGTDPVGSDRLVPELAPAGRVVVGSKVPSVFGMGVVGD